MRPWLVLGGAVITAVALTVILRGSHNTAEDPIGRLQP
jgi:hypothetical protein